MSNETAHDAITNRLSEYIDGELDARERADVERHLDACASCRDVAEQLRAVAAQATALVDRAPDRELWDDIATRIGATGQRVTRLVPRATRRFSFTLPQLAAAGLALMVLSGAAVWIAKTGDPRVDFPPVAGNTTLPDAATRAPEIAPVRLGDPHFEGAVEDLERILAEGRSRLDPQTVRVLEQNLAAIDAAIEQSRSALEKDPANTYLNNHLAAAQQRKLALLRRATALTSGS